MQDGDDLVIRLRVSLLVMHIRYQLLPPCEAPKPRDGIEMSIKKYTKTETSEQIRVHGGNVSELADVVYSLRGGATWWTEPEAIIFDVPGTSKLLEVPYLSDDMRAGTE